MKRPRKSGCTEKAKKGQHAAGDVSPSAVGRSRTGADPDDDDDVGMHHDDEEDTSDDAESLPEPKQVKEMMTQGCGSTQGVIQGHSRGRTHSGTF
jgi:hypothetical protein